MGNNYSIENDANTDTGNKKALIIGLDFSKNKTTGCIPSLRLLKYILEDDYGYEIKTQDSRWNLPFDIIEAINWLFKDAKKGDKLVLYYARVGEMIETVPLLCEKFKPTIKVEDYMIPIEYLQRCINDVPEAVQMTIINESAMDIKIASNKEDVMILNGKFKDIYVEDYGLKLTLFIKEIADMIDAVGVNNATWANLSDMAQDIKIINPINKSIF